MPAVHVEALELAIWFPVVWRRGEAGFSLVALRTLLSDGRGQPPGSPEVPGSLPLLLRAYPFIASPDVDQAEGIWVDDTVADQPTDIGAPILDERGIPSRGAQLRIRATAVFRAHYEATAAMTGRLAEHEAFEPWPLELEVGSERVEIGDLVVVRPAVLDSPFVPAFIREFGLRGARLLAAHSVSLFRAGVLFGAARTAMAAGAGAGPSAASAAGPERAGATVGDGAPEEGSG